VYDSYRVRAVQGFHSFADGFGYVARVKFLDQMGDNFGVCIGYEFVAFFLQLLF
jgi:hypothetical protein